MKFVFVLILMSVMSISIYAQKNNSDYAVFDAAGNSSTVSRIIDAVEKSDVIFLGEQHDDAVAHRLQMELFAAIFEKYGARKKIALSLEMFERDVQTILDEYLQSKITETHFLAASRPWGNYKTDYRPLVEFARERNLPVIAANAPRRYVNMVARLGRDSLKDLSPDAKNWIAPLPFERASETYAAKFNALMGGMTDSISRHAPMLESQTLWDATMAYSIAEHLRRDKNALVVHLNGSFHTENRLGTVEHLTKYQPKARVLVITMKYEEDFNNFNSSKHANLGDFVILTNSKVPRSQK